MGRFTVMMLAVAVAALCLVHAFPRPDDDDEEGPVTMDPLTDPPANYEEPAPVYSTPAPDCTAPKETGNCTAAFQRFYYDTEANQCKKFIYGGCRGNGNNFKTKDLCESTCVQP